MNNVWTVAVQTPCTGLRNTSTKSLRSILPFNGCTRTFSSRQCFLLPKRTAPTTGPQSSPDFDKELRSYQLRWHKSGAQVRKTGKYSWAFHLGRRELSTTTRRNVSEKVPPEGRPVGSYPISSNKEAKPDIAENEAPPISNDGNALPDRKPEEELEEEHEPTQIMISESLVKSVLGSDLPFETGVQVLQELQFRRVTGSLAEEGIDFPNLPEVTEEQATSALEWLRQNYPVDEEAAAAAWAEDEAAKLEAGYTEKAEKLWLYKRNPELDGPVEIQSHDEGGLYGQSVLEQRRKEQEAKEKEEEELRLKKSEEEGKPLDPYKGYDLVVKQRVELDERKERKHQEWERYRKAAELPTEKVLAERSAFSRLWASWLLGLTSIAALTVFAQSYDPPTRSERLFPDYPPAYVTCGAIALINAIVFLAWRRPEAYKFMNRYFLMSSGHPNPFSLIGSIFSHQDFWHFARTGVLFLFLIGPPLHEDISRGPFLAVYLSTGIIGYLTSLTYSVLTRDVLLATIGSSGAIYGLIAAYFALESWRRFPFTDAQYPTDPFVAYLFIHEALRFWKTRKGRSMTGGLQTGAAGMDYLSHLGGLVSGAGIGYWIRYRGEGAIRLGGKSEVDRIKSSGAVGDVVIEQDDNMPAVERVG